MKQTFQSALHRSWESKTCEMTRYHVRIEADVHYLVWVVDFVETSDKGNHSECSNNGDTCALCVEKRFDVTATWL